MKQIQFELWQECNSKCSFCYLGCLNNITPDDEKLEHLDYIFNSINDLSLYKEYDTIAYLGGEFFQGQMKNPLVKEKFMQLMEKTAWLKDNGYIKNVWIYATLTIGDQSDLYETLSKYNNKDGLWILTSYDTLGRFHTQKMEDNWKYHMKHIHELYPDIKFNTTIILSGDFIEKYLSNTFNMNDFMNEFNTTLYFKVPNRMKDKFTTNKAMNDSIGNFFPQRKTFLTFLRTVKSKESADIWNRLFSMNLRADTLVCKHNGQMFESTRDKEHFTELYDKNLDHIMSCGHLSIYSPYSDCDGCAICDKKIIDEMM